MCCIRLTNIILLLLLLLVLLFDWLSVTGSLLEEDLAWCSRPWICCCCLCCYYFIMSGCLSVTVEQGANKVDNLDLLLTKFYQHSKDPTFIFVLVCWYLGLHESTTFHWELLHLLDKYVYIYTYITSEQAKLCMYVRILSSTIRTFWNSNSKNIMVVFL